MENLCTFDGCENIIRVKSRGLCSGHNYQWKMGYELYPIGSKYLVTRFCKYKTCDDKYFCNGYCLMHYNMISKLGITPEQYDDMFEKQNGVCSICSKPHSSRRGRLSVDHDHSCCPGRKSCGRCIRGLLCDKCNLGVGNFGDSMELLEKAVAYLSRHKHYNTW